MINIDDIIPSQIELRNVYQLESMIDFVRGGGLFTKSVIEDFARKNNIPVCPLIQLVKFDNGKILNHDGHHRTLAVYMGGRDYLTEDEYFLVERSYEMYDEINFEAGWVTPHDPRKEIRLGDFGGFKKHVRELSKVSEENAVKYIRSNKNMYVTRRSGILHIMDINGIPELKIKV